MILRDIKQVGVVGGGTMGFGIAINFALGGYTVIVSDISDEILEQSKKKVKAALGLFAEERLITSQEAEKAASLITFTTNLAELAANSDFITEAIVEKFEDKKELFNKLDKLCPPHTILASNTSGLVLSEFGAEAKRQDKIVITHYFAPPHIVPGVEVAKASGTSDETYNITYELMKKAEKIPIRVLTERPGYLINRIQKAMREEAQRLWAEGVATAEEIELGIKSTFGFRLPHEGPMLHYDLACIWKWPKEVLARSAAKLGVPEPPPSAEVVAKLRERATQGTTWFVDLENLDEATEKRDREFIRRLKALYRKEK